MGSQPVDDDELMVEPGVGAELIEASEGSGLGVGCTERHQVEACCHCRARAHGAGLDGDNEHTSAESPGSGDIGGIAQRQDLGVRSRVVRGLTFVVACREDGAVGTVGDDGANGHVAVGRGEASLFQRAAHEAVEQVRAHLSWRRRGRR